MAPGSLGSPAGLTEIRELKGKHDMRGDPAGSRALWSFKFISDIKMNPVVGAGMETRCRPSSISKGKLQGLFMLLVLSSSSLLEIQGLGEQLSLSQRASSFIPLLLMCIFPRAGGTLDEGLPNFFSKKPDSKNFVLICLCYNYSILPG